MSILIEKQQEIERTRLQLHDLVLEKAGNLIDKDVAELSMYLDRLIVDYEREKSKQKKRQCDYATGR